MANPARVPVNPVPPAGADPFTPDARNPANSSERVVNRVETRSGGSSVLIAAIVLVLAVIAYFVFAPGSDDAPVEPATTTTTEPATPEPATPAPDATAPAAPEATAPAAPADPATPAPDATAPAAPADPAAPAPDAAAPAPAEPAPAQ
jgi:hypothetical protein